MRSDYIAHYLYLLLLDRVVRIVNFDVSLQGFLNQYLLEILDFHNYLEGELFQCGNFVSEVTRVLVNRNPDAYCMSLDKTVELINIETVVNISLKSCYVFDTSILVPVMNLVVEPAVFFQKNESFFASEEF